MAPINSLSGLRQRYANDPTRLAAINAGETEGVAEAGRELSGLQRNNDAAFAAASSQDAIRSRALRIDAESRPGSVGLEAQARNRTAAMFGPNTRGVTLSGPGNGSSNSLREAAAYAESSPGLRRGGDVFGRNDREAHMAANRERIASGIGSITRYRQIQNKERAQRMANDQEYRMEGLRRRGDIAKERVAQQGQKEIEGLRQRGANHRARGEYQLGMAQLAAQQKSNEEMVKAIGQRPKTPEQMAEDQFNDEKQYFGNAKFDYDRGEYYRDGGDGQRIYFGARSNQHLMNDWVNNVAPSKMQYRDGRFFVPGENGGRDRYLPKEASDAWVNFYASNGDPNLAMQDDEGNWFARGVPVMPEYAQMLDAKRDPEFKRWGRQLYEMTKGTNGRLPDGFEPVMRPDGNLSKWDSRQEVHGGYKRFRPFELKRIRAMEEEERRAAAQAAARAGLPR